ncbi:hypothetical protein ACWC9S_15040 [Streptomyces xiamenensis]
MNHPPRARKWIGFAPLGIPPIGIFSLENFPLTKSSILPLAINREKPEPMKIREKAAGIIHMEETFDNRS